MSHHRWIEELAVYLQSQIPGAVSHAPSPASPPPAELIAGLFDRQQALNPAAQSWLIHQGWVPRSVQSLADIPALPVAAFKLLELTTVPSTDRTALFHSSGTTAHTPSRHFHSSETLKIYEL